MDNLSREQKYLMVRCIKNLDYEEILVDLPEFFPVETAKGFLDAVCKRVIEHLGDDYSPVDVSNNFYREQTVIISEGGINYLKGLLAYYVNYQVTINAYKKSEELVNDDISIVDVYYASYSKDFIGESILTLDKLLGPLVTKENDDLALCFGFRHGEYFELLELFKN